MAIRQYIGARYVPKYMGHFDSTIEYEPLSIVDDANGNSYTSKIPVPAGSSLSDQTYWAPTGNFSGAVLQLQTRMTAAEGNISDLQGDMTTAEDNITDLQGDVAEIDQKVRNIKNRKFLFIFDSYGTTYGNTPGVNTTIETAITVVYGNIAKSISVNGGGFVRDTGTGTFLSNLQSAVSGGTITPADYTDVVVAAGRNDWTATREELSSAVAAFYNYCKTTFPDAKLWWGYIANGQNDAEHGTTIQQFNCKKNLNDAALRNGVDILKGVDNILHYYPYMSSDFIHPNETGKTALAYALMQALTGGCDPFTIAATTPTITARSGFTVTNVSGTWINYADNGISVIVPPALMRIDLDTPITQAINSVDFADIGGNTLLKNPYASILIPAAVTIVDKNGSLSVVAGRLSIDSNGTVSVYPLYAPEAIAPTAGITSIVVMPTSAQFPSSVG